LSWVRVCERPGIENHMNEELDLTVDCAKLHFFDKVTGDAYALGVGSLSEQFCLGSRHFRLPD
jgi:hypothetical protein